MKKILSLVMALSLVILGACSTAENSSSQGTTSTEADTKSHNIVVTINGVDYRATLNDSKATQSLLEQLPLTLTFRDYASGFDEKISDLDQALDYGDDQYENDPDALDIAYWSPDERLVFYYGDVGAYSGIHVLGHFDSENAQEAITQLDEASTVTIRLAE